MRKQQIVLRPLCWQRWRYGDGPGVKRLRKARHNAGEREKGRHVVAGLMGERLKLIGPARPVERRPWL